MGVLSFLAAGDEDSFKGDKFRKLRHLDDALQERCKEAWDVERVFVVDERRVKLHSKWCA